MSKNKNNESGYTYFQDTEETVIRKDETQKNAVAKFVKRKKNQKIFLNILSIVLVVAIVVSSLFIGKRGIEKFLVLRQEQKQHDSATLPENIKEIAEDFACL